MAVISNISVGDVIYYTVDDIPTHIAPKGSISIVDSSQSSYDNTVFYINNDGGTVWLKAMTTGEGSIYLGNGTTGVIPDDASGQVLGSWYAFNSVNSWSANSIGNDFNFIPGDDNIIYTGDTKIRALIKQSSTMRGGPSKWVSWECGPSFNFTVPTKWNECFARDNSSTINVQATRLQDMQSGNYVLAAISPISREAAGTTATRTYLPKYCQLTTVKVDEALKKNVINETFESSGFTNGGWSVVNNTTNVWVVGQAQHNGGTSSAYISNNGGASANYNNIVPNISHFYKDFTFGSTADAISLVFDWKCDGENAAGATQYDYGAVVITTTGTTPVAGTEVSTAQAISGGNGRIGATANLGKFNLNYGITPGTVWNTESIDITAYSGQTKRIVFTWVNDLTVGTNPPMIIDNIRINEYTW